MLNRCIRCLLLMNAINFSAKSLIKNALNSGTQTVDIIFTQVAVLEPEQQLLARRQRARRHSGAAAAPGARQAARVLHAVGGKHAGAQRLRPRRRGQAVAAAAASAHYHRSKISTFVPVTAARSSSNYRNRTKKTGLTFLS